MVRKFNLKEYKMKFVNHNEDFEILHSMRDLPLTCDLKSLNFIENIIENNIFYNLYELTTQSNFKFYFAIAYKN